jgi:branched-chain amino acid transport system substrate-binding protein
MKGYRSTVFTLLFLGVFTLFMGTAAAEVGVTDKEIKIGNITDTTGPIAGYGVPRIEATRALFQSINDSGGIHGRKLILLHESDGYKPPNTVMAFKKLVEVDKVFAFIGSLGVATAMAIIPEVQKQKIPYVMLG